MSKDNRFVIKITQGLQWLLSTSGNVFTRNSIKVWLTASRELFFQRRNTAKFLRTYIANRTFNQQCPLFVLRRPYSPRLWFLMQSSSTSPLQKVLSRCLLFPLLLNTARICSNKLEGVDCALNTQSGESVQQQPSPWLRDPYLFPFVIHFPIQNVS